MTYWLVLVIAGFLTWLSIKKYHFLYSLGATLGWFALWGYHTTNPPTNITIGTFVYDILYYLYILFAIGMLLIFIAGWKNQQSQSRTTLSVQDGKIVANTITTENQSRSDRQTPEEYRMQFSRALRRGRKRR